MPQSAVRFWVFAWLGATAAGGLFGLVAGGATGFFAGVIVAGMTGAPIHVTAAAMTWVLWLSRFRVAMAGLAGAATGVAATLLAFDPALFDFTFGVSLLIAGSIGGLGSALVGALGCWEIGRHAETPDAGQRRRWRFTRRDLLVRVAVLAGLLFGWVCLLEAIRLARRSAERESCKNNLRLISLALRDYHAAHGCLPPASIADGHGNPTLSWRVLAAQYVHYDHDFEKQLDYSKPWDSPTNARFLRRLDAGWLRCPAATESKPGMTHYVAVVGPGTLWPPDGSAKLPASKQCILVVEWPKSNIHWTEPRDITVDEFLDWYRSKPRSSNSNHPGCILYVDAGGRVHELPNDSDPDTVRGLLTAEAVELEQSN